jgi:hypothetical protein
MEKPPDLDQNVWNVMESHRTRAEFGKQKYGVDTTRTDLGLHEWLTHLQEEVMDAAIYVEAVRNEISKGFRGRFYNGFCRTDDCQGTAHYWDSERSVFVCSICATKRNEESWEARGEDVCTVMVLQASACGSTPQDYANWAKAHDVSEDTFVRKHLKGTHSPGFQAEALRLFRGP